MRKAFTLAEVLITLGIIGVVAALTMPALIANYKEQQTIAKLKKVYSTFDNALHMAINEQGSTADQWGLVASQPQPLADILKPNLLISKDCGTQPKGCFAPAYYTLIGGSNGFNDSNTLWSKFVLNDGTSAAVWTSASSPIIGWIAVDLNGKEGPNKSGVDLFWFEIFKDRVIPSGADESFVDFETGCKVHGANFNEQGRGCTAWVILNGNMDYLHCNDLSWGGKTKCN